MKHNIDWGKDAIVICCLGRDFVCCSSERTEQGFTIEKISDILFTTKNFQEVVWNYISNKMDEYGCKNTKKEFYKIVENDKLLSSIILNSPLMSEHDIEDEKIEKIRPVAKLLGNLYMGSGDDFKYNETLGIPDKILVPVDKDFACVDVKNTTAVLVIKKLGKGVATLLDIGSCGKIIMQCENLYDCLSILSDRLLKINDNKHIETSDGVNFDDNDDRIHNLRNVIKIGLGDEFSKMREDKYGVDGKNF